MAGYAAAGGALVGGIVGSKSKADRGVSGLERNSYNQSESALNNYSAFAAAGANIGDVKAGAQAQRDFASTLQDYQGKGMYDFTAGRQLASQQFDPQRVALQQSFQDQLNEANKAAAASGRSSNDPILRARLAQDQTRQQALLGANQNAAAVDFARQSVTDKIGLAGQRASTLDNLSNQAFSHYSNLFNMAQTSLASERSNSYNQQTLDANKGGGWVGFLSGAMQGASSGASMGQSFAASSALSRSNQPGIQPGPMQVQPASFGGGANYPGGADSSYGGAMPARSGGYAAPAQSYSPTQQSAWGAVPFAPAYNAAGAGGGYYGPQPYNVPSSGSSGYGGIFSGNSFSGK